MEEMNRRSFIKNVAIGGAVLGLGNSVFHTPTEALASGKTDIGQCKNVRIKCVSELVCIDPKVNINTIMRAGGLKVNQWDIPWVPENSAGYCTLIDMETLDGRHVKMLLDAGGSVPYMQKCLKREGVDKMLKNSEIESLVISHEHPDHLWGLEAVLEHDPKIKIHIPDTFYPEGMYLLDGAQFLKPGAGNLVPHKGELVKLKPGKIGKIHDGCAVAAFEKTLALRTRGEQSLYFNVKDKGIVCVTGCCHQGVLTMADFARNNIAGSEKMYGIYGGLHISLFGGMNDEKERMVRGMAKYDFKKVACNHCTGIEAVKTMVKLGYPVVKGTGRFGSWTDMYVGNGDEVFFG